MSETDQGNNGLDFKLNRQDDLWSWLWVKQSRYTMYNMSLLRLYRKQSWNDWLRLVDCHHHPSKMTHYWYFSVRCGWCVSHQLKHCKWCQWIALDTNCTYLSCFLFCFINCNALQLSSFVVRFWFSYILLVTMTTDLSPTYNQPLKCLTYKSMLHSGDYHLIPGPQVVNLFKGACQSSLACSSEFCTVINYFFSYYCKIYWY